MINLLIVDDHVSFRVPLAAILDRESDIAVAGQAGSIAEALELIESIAFDAALVDLTLPDGHGVDLLPLLARAQPDAALVVLTGVTHAQAMPMAVAAGAVGFISKTADVEEIVAALRTVSDGHSLIPPVEAMRLVRQAAELQTRASTTDRALSQLSPRELDVLRSLARGLDNHAIANELNLGTNTVRSHITHLLNKLGVHSRLQAALIAVRHEIVSGDEILPPSAPSATPNGFPGEHNEPTSSK
jgi:two-component system NarL family response regulator